MLPQHDPRSSPGEPDPWSPAAGPLFNPAARVRLVPIGPDAQCVVIDDILAQPEAVARWAAQQDLREPEGYPYPGLVAPAPASVSALLSDHFGRHVRGLLGGRRTLDGVLRTSLVTVPTHALEPRQWLCHRDRVADDPAAWLFAASVLYLFRDPALGGTSFYRPRLPQAQLNRLLADSQQLDAATFAARYGLQPGYMAGSNDWFEQVASVPAAWNRAIYYDGGIFHSADITHPAALSRDPARGRLTLNGFYTCRRAAR